MGQFGANLGNPNITGPQQNQAQWGDLDPSEKGARIAAGGIGGLARGFQNYTQQNQAMRRPQMQANNPFFGGYGGG